MYCAFSRLTPSNCPFPWLLQPNTFYFFQFLVWNLHFTYVPWRNLIVLMPGSIKTHLADCIHIHPFRFGAGLAAYEGSQPLSSSERICINQTEFSQFQNVGLNFNCTLKEWKHIKSELAKYKSYTNI